MTDEKAGDMTATQDTARAESFVDGNVSKDIVHAVEGEL